MYTIQYTVAAPVSELTSRLGDGGRSAVRLFTCRWALISCSGNPQWRSITPLDGSQCTDYCSPGEPGGRTAQRLGCLYSVDRLRPAGSRPQLMACTVPATPLGRSRHPLRLCGLRPHGAAASVTSHTAAVSVSLSLSVSQSVCLSVGTSASDRRRGGSPPS